MTSQKTRPQCESALDKEPCYSFIQASIRKGAFNTTIAREVTERYGIPTTDSSIGRFRKRHQVQIPGTRRAFTDVQGDFAEAQTEPVGYVRKLDDPPILDDPDRMLRDRGLDPEEWYIDAIRVNEWDGPHVDGNVVRYYQAKFTAQRRKPEAGLLPARSDGWKRPTRRVAVQKRQSKLVVICGDQQAPFQDENLHQLFLEWLRQNRPDEGVNLGDLMDFPDISRHPDDPENVAHANECLQTGYNVQRGYVDASPRTEWAWLPGNHDLRLRDYLLKNAPRVYDIKRVDTPESDGEIVNRIEYLMRLDELGIEYVDTRGTYEDGQINLSSNLAVRHGWKLRQKAGESAHQTLQTLGHSVLIGHTHRQAVVHHTYHEIDGGTRQLLAAEIGCMCRLDKRGERDYADRRFPAYATAANWQQGFCTASIYPDGKFRIDLATYVNDTLLWRDQRYQ